MRRTIYLDGQPLLHLDPEFEAISFQILHRAVVHHALRYGRPPARLLCHPSVEQDYHTLLTVERRGVDYIPIDEGVGRPFRLVMSFRGIPVVSDPGLKVGEWRFEDPSMYRPSRREVWATHQYTITGTPTGTPNTNAPTEGAFRQAVRAEWQAALDDFAVRPRPLPRFQGLPFQGPTYDAVVTDELVGPRRPFPEE